jgi:hypothetical protein
VSLTDHLLVHEDTGNDEERITFSRTEAMLPELNKVQRKYKCRSEPYQEALSKSSVKRIFSETGVGNRSFFPTNKTTSNVCIT